MKEFLKSNTVTHNLMSFTGFKTVLIFSLLLESPKSYNELKKALKENEYLHETASTDSLRMYINSLKNFGCNISKITENKTTKYFIEKHPFMLSLEDNHIKSLIKIYKAISNSIDINDLILLHDFFKNISPYIKNEDLKKKLLHVSPFYKIDNQLLNELAKAINKKATITVYYNSMNSGKKMITINSDKMYVSNNKVYISGFNKEHQNYASFLVTQILQLVKVEENVSQLSDIEVFRMRIKYYKSDTEYLELKNNETIVEENENFIIIDSESTNKFDLIQRVLYLGAKCKIIGPQCLKEEVIKTLQKMKEVYDD